MNGKSISFIIEKGGTGKSTLCFNIGWELSRKSKVLLIDLDGQAANLTYFTGTSKDDILTIRDILNGDVKSQEAIVPVKKNLDIIPADNSLMDIGTPSHFNQLSMQKGFQDSNEYQMYLIREMKKIVRWATKAYDFVLLDPNPSPNYLHTLSLCSSDYVIIPVLPDAASIVSDEGTAESLKIIRKYGINKDIEVLGILFNRHTTRTLLSKQVMSITKDLANDIGTTVFNNSIRNSVVLAECVGMHTGITDYRPKCPAADDVRAVVSEIKRRIRRYGD